MAQIVGREAVAVRRPEKETRPKLFYKGAHQATLDPLAARRPDGGLFMWSEQGPQVAGSGPGTRVHATLGRRAALLRRAAPRAVGLARQPLHVDEGHRRGRVPRRRSCSLLADLLAGGGSLWLWAAPAAGLVFLALTGAILIWDLEHPRRFYYIFPRPQWRSWLVRGAVIAHAVRRRARAPPAAVGRRRRAQRRSGSRSPASPLAVMAAVYTAYLFAQAKARDLWQSPLLPPHLLVQAVLLGAAVTAALRRTGWSRGRSAASSGCSPAPRSSTCSSLPAR